MVMDKAIELVWEYIVKGHDCCPLLWTRKKWTSFVKEKIIEAIIVLSSHPDMNLPFGYNYLTRNLPKDLA